MIASLKSLIFNRQKAFHNHGGESTQYKFYRNVVNRERKMAKAKFYCSKVEHMKQVNPKTWWKEVKRLSGSQSHTDDLINQIQDGSIENYTRQELANVINKAFLDPLQEYRISQPLNFLPIDEESVTYPEVTEMQVQAVLSKLNPSKAGGPDEIPNWLLKEYPMLLALPVSKIINTSFKEMRLPSIWKVANVIPLPKVKPVGNINQHLRPISLTASLSKVTENFVVHDYVKPAVLKILDPNQYGAVPNSSTVHALIHMVHVWLKETDGNGATVRTILFDYRKAFDLIDHRILVEKLCALGLPNCIVNWIIDFLSYRLQRTKLADDCFSEWGSVPSGVPQGTRLGPWLFLLLINDLVLNDKNAYLWKYVDDTTSSEIVAKGHPSCSQNIADSIVQWSSRNKLKLNDEKCKELRICFAKNQDAFQPINVNGKDLEVVESVKLLGLTVTNDLSWNIHIENVVKKAAKRLYFLVQLKRAKLPRKDLVLFYVTCIRSIITYAIPVFFYALPKYLQNELERLQKRAFSIINPDLTYHEALAESNIPTVISYGEKVCRDVFKSTINNDSDKLNKLLPPTHEAAYQLRNNRRFFLPNWHTNRFKNTFIVTSVLINDG